MKQIRQFLNSEGLVVLTSHDRPALVVLDVERCWRLLCGAELLVQILAAGNLVEAAKTVSAADANEVVADRDWIRRNLAELKPAESVQPKIRSFERPPNPF